MENKHSGLACVGQCSQHPWGADMALCSYLTESCALYDCERGPLSCALPASGKSSLVKGYNKLSALSTGYNTLNNSDYLGLSRMEKYSFSCLWEPIMRDLFLIAHLPSSLKLGFMFLFFSFFFSLEILFPLYIK